MCVSDKGIGESKKKKKEKKGQIHVIKKKISNF